MATPPSDPPAQKGLASTSKRREPDTTCSRRTTMKRLPHTTAARRDRHRTSQLLPAVAAVALVGLLAGCGSGQTSTSSDEAGVAAGSSVANAHGSQPQNAAAGAPRAAGPADVSLSTGRAASVPSSTKEDSASELVDVTPRSLVKTAAVTLRSDDVGKVLQQISDAVVIANGEIASEQTSTNAHGQPIHTRLVLRVPVGTFDASLNKVSSFGRLKSLARSVDDVTADVADIDSRVRSAEDSIAQLRQLFGAAKRLGQVIALESELSQREADLEALQAQQRALADQTAMSTITVTVSRPPHSPVAPATERAGGFVAGLKSGWHALGAFVTSASRAVGVLVPFALVAMLGFVVLWFAVRRFRPQPRPRASE